MYSVRHNKKTSYEIHQNNQRSYNRNIIIVILSFLVTERSDGIFPDSPDFTFHKTPCWGKSALPYPFKEPLRSSVYTVQSRTFV